MAYTFEYTIEIFKDYIWRKDDSSCVLTLSSLKATLCIGLNYKLLL